MIAYRTNMPVVYIRITVAPYLSIPAQCIQQRENHPPTIAGYDDIPNCQCENSPVYISDMMLYVDRALWFVML